MDAGSNRGCEVKHKNHVCVLQGKGLIHQVQILTCTPNIEFEKYNRMANTEDNVCMPVPLFI